MKIDLNDLTSGGKIRNLAGKDRGISARSHFELDKLDLADEPVEVHAPDKIYAISSSFIIGMFGRSFNSFPDKEKFFRHYRFQTSSYLFQQIDHGVNRILVTLNHDSLL